MYGLHAVSSHRYYYTHLTASIPRQHIDILVPASRYQNIKPLRILLQQETMKLTSLT